MDKQDSSRDTQAQPGAAAEPLHVVPASHPAPAPRKKRPGPKTPQGKARVRHNAMRFGIHSTDPVIPGIERPDDWRLHREGVIASLAPVGYLETQLTERIALLVWRLKRITVYEQVEYARANASSQEFRLPASNELDKIMRYEAHLHRQWLQTQHEREVLEKRRRGEATPLARVDVQGVTEP